jgi:hypothetical protein
MIGLKVKIAGEWVTIAGIQGEQGIQGIQGETGATGAVGADGADGLGVPVGGSTGQVLAKASATDNDTQWVDAPSALITTNRQVAASYTLVLSDANKLVEMNVGSANDLTIPLNSSVAFPIGTQILIAQYGAGQTSVLATGGVTIRSANGDLKLTARYSGATLIKIATDEWYLFGDLTT